MQVQRVDPSRDASAFAEWFAIWHLTDLEKFPDEMGWDELDLAAMARPRTFVEVRLLLARSPAGEAVGVAHLHLSQRDNRHACMLDVRVHPDHRRRGIGRALVEEVARQARAEGRTVINMINDVPVAQEATHSSAPFARALGFTSTHAGHRRTLALPPDEARFAALRAEVAAAPGASDYRILTFRGRWPEAFVDDECALERAMSTDQPQGDQQAEEEVWDAARIAELDDNLRAQGIVSLTAVAQHIESDRLVAYSRIAIAERRPTEAWQWATIVLGEHRGHRLGLAVKLANLEFLRQELPTARRVMTSNAAVNGPMIAVNDMMGFEIDAVGAFWQKPLVRHPT